MMIKAIDFCCGAGGLTRGLLNAGIEVLAGVDNDERLRKTYSENNKPSRFISRKIQDIDIHKLRSELGILPGDPTLYAACTPCQPFSSLSKTKTKDQRRMILIEFAHLVEESPPDFVLVENVPGLNNAYGKELYELFLSILAGCGFTKVADDLLDAKRHGVPQTRKRFILATSRHGWVSLPSEIHYSQIATVRSCIDKYPTISDGEEQTSYRNHVARKLQPHHKQIVSAVPKDGGSRLDIADTSILLQCHRDKPRVHKDVFGRMAWDEPSPTLTCRCTDVYCGRFIHPEQDRGISLREAAALQTFEDNYEFFGGSILELARQIGNAVPVKLAEKLGHSFMKLY